MPEASVRVVHVSCDGAVLRAQGLPGDPAGVAVTEDGTIDLMDSAGMKTKDTLLLDQAGNTKGQLPQTWPRGDSQAVAESSGLAAPDMDR
jgi:hypothetical protein